MGLFLPSYSGTKITFIKDILRNKKQVFRQNEVKHIEVPHYEELSVKNLYKDALKDNALRSYLPEEEEDSNRQPERDFFFGIVGTVKPDYLTKIIADANNERYGREGPKNEKTLITIGD